MGHWIASESPPRAVATLVFDKNALRKFAVLLGEKASEDIGDWSRTV